MRLATLNDLDEIMDIVKEALVLMKKDGNPQWGEGYPMREDFEKDVLEKTLRVFSLDSRIVGFFCLNHDEEEEYPSVSWEKDGTADVIHRLVVAHRVYGQGVGSILLGYAEGLSKNTGRKYIRLDTHETNKGMNTLLLKQGYTFRGQISFSPSIGQFNCYDKTTL